MCLILRPLGDKTFQLLGPAFIHGFNEAQGVLGKIPHPWIPKVHRPGDFLRFDNIETGETTFDDPRLKPLEDGWVMTTVEETGTYEFYHKTTRKTTESDPRCTLAKLRQRISVKEFLLL